MGGLQWGAFLLVNKNKNMQGGRLDILEYCDSSVVIEKEQYYLDMLKRNTISCQ